VEDRHRREVAIRTPVRFTIGPKLVVGLAAQPVAGRGVRRT
jgi:hypothetical protein